MYSIKKVSEILDIPAVTIRAWENRYHVISPTRTDGGHRLYSKKDIETLKWLKEQVQENNMKISEAVRLLTEKNNTPIETPSTNKGYDGLMEQLYHALMDYETVKANTIIDLAFSLYDYEEVFHNILVPVLYRIGNEWENGHISVAQEHFSSQFVIQRCTQFLRILPINQHLPKALAFCPEGEHHHIGLLLFSLFLRKKGIEVLYLGPNTPLAGLTDLIERKNIAIVAISITNPKPFGIVQSWIKDCLEEYPTLKFVLGGNFQKHSETFNLNAVSYLQYSEWEEWYQSTFMNVT